MSNATGQASLWKISCAFLTSSRDHWKELIGGSFVAILIGVALTMGFNIPRFIAGLIAFCLAVLLACFLAFRDQYRKAEQLEELVKSRIGVTCGRKVEKSILTANAFTFFRARLDLIGIQPVRNITAAITDIRKDGNQLHLNEAPRLMLHPGYSSLAELREGIPEFVDVLKVEPDGRLALALIGHYPAVDTYSCSESGYTYELDISITGSTRTRKCTFVFNWTGDRDTADLQLK
jgi:uncharacterized membrane protein